jgi:hypothetical protein
MEAELISHAPVTSEKLNPGFPTWYSVFYLKNYIQQHGSICRIRELDLERFARTGISLQPFW